jgi:hypothetical protein
MALLDADRTEYDEIISRGVLARRDVVTIVSRIEQVIANKISVFRIKATKELIEVDILLFGFLALFRDQQVDMQFEFWVMPGNSTGSVYQKIQQSRLHGQLSLGKELFILKQWDGSKELGVLPIDDSGMPRGCYRKSSHPY